jgi:hypothetical protein
MKKLIIPAVFIFLSGLLLSSCDKINPPYTEDNNLPVDTTECPIPDFPVKTQHNKVVLLEEYTGHYCPNCPTAATIAHNMVNKYPDSLIVIAVHSGYFAGQFPPEYTLNLTNTTGETLHDYFGINPNPAAIFNRKSINGSLIDEAYAAWESDFLSVVDTLPVLDMQIINNYNEAEKKVCIHIQTEYLVDLDRSLKLAVYITEDSITGNQKTNVSPYIIPNYVFMNVLRGAVNNTWGDDLSTTAITAGTKKISNYKLSLDPSWNDDQCYIVAFVYDAGSEEILMAAKEKVSP